MKKYKIFDKATGLYIGTANIRTSEVRNYERDFIIKEA